MDTVWSLKKYKPEGTNNYCPLRPKQTPPFTNLGENWSLLIHESKWKEPNNDKLRSHNINTNTAHTKTRS
jgi:hypothetical protein